MFYKRGFLFLITLVIPVLALTQDCKYSVSGYIKDVSTGIPISDANVLLEESQSGTFSDSSGYFQLQNICPESYHLSVSHIGCETQRFFLNINRDTVLQISLDHYGHMLDDVEISSESTQSTTVESQTLSEQKITESVGQNLSNMLETISGVSTLSNGSGIAKPVVHGLYGNRLIILNNGVAQSGQQWGNDHSPEIDPLVATKISVIKGVGALEYQGSSLGSIILVEPEKIHKEPHLHGKVNYFFESNGLGNALNVQLQKYSDLLAWKLNGSLKKSGDNRSSDYYLNNTGSEEANIALQLEKSFSEKWYNELYFSSFNTRIGVLRGAHIGNTTDLEEALNRDIPFYTEEEFSYNIDAPYQKVNHHLLKLNSKYFFNDNEWLDLTYAGQLNIRKEFDVRRSGRSDIPALSLEQLSNFVEGKYNKHFNNDAKLKTGFQVNIVDNTNNPETGILPLIPDYLTFESGLFFLVNKAFDKVFFELGGRYDNINQEVLAISQTLPREIIRYDNNFHNLSATGGISYRPSGAIELTYNAGYISRNPAINELYSNGLHQGVSGIELGDPDLQTEQSIKSTFSLEGRAKEALFFEALFYYQNIYDYIFLNPQNEVELTIRGAFPVFKYEQTDARIYGFDFNATYSIQRNFNLNVKYSYLKGQDITKDIPLVNMPPNNLAVTLNYELGQVGKFENLKLELNNKYVFKQGHLLPSQDFISAPSAYNLTGFKVSIQRQLRQQRLNLYAGISNLFNVKYRDYLNRQRYFANDLGRSVRLGFSLSF